MDRCERCFKPADHTHPRCGHCHGTGRCPVPFCVKCADPRFDDLPFPCGTCLWCAGEGIDLSRQEKLPVVLDHRFAGPLETLRGY